jgi:hypothetical protein
MKGKKFFKNIFLDIYFLFFIQITQTILKKHNECM